jgi:hypothetical protein
MPRTFALLFAAAALLGPAAQASPLSSLTWSQDLAGISIDLTGTDTNTDGVTDGGDGSCIDTLGTHVQTSITCPAGIAGASGSATLTSYSVSLTLPLFSLNTFTTGGAIDVDTIATFMGMATITGTASMAVANGGIPGMVTVKVAAHVAKGANASMQAPGKTTLVKLPLSIGAAGRHTGWFYLLEDIHYITVDFYAWTPHSKIFTGLTSKFAALPTPTLVAMGSFQKGPYRYTLPPSHFPLSREVLRTQGTGVAVTLVAPSRIRIDGPLAQRRTATFTSLSLLYRGDPVDVIHGTPEPRTLLLLGAALAAFRLARSRRRS